MTVVRPSCILSTVSMSFSLRTGNMLVAVLQSLTSYQSQSPPFQLQRNLSTFDG